MKYCCFLNLIQTRVGNYFCTASDAKRVRAFGRGIQPHGLRVQDEAKFKIVTEGAGEGVPEVNVIGPGKNPNQWLCYDNPRLSDIVHITRGLDHPGK